MADPTGRAFRPEIEGLRGVAVLAVLVFHAREGWLPGGFWGVDAFFVISGALITPMIVRGLERGTFSWPAFFARRLRRLAPALVATLLLTFLFGLLVLSPEAMVRLGIEAGAAALGASNIYFATQGGYFEPDLATRPLLHTWSLGVEEQFYLVWPALVLALRRRLAVLLAAALGGGFVLAVAVALVDQQAAFFWMPFRIWQFAVGALATAPLLTTRLALWTPGARSALALAGCTALLASFALLDDWSPWAALAPTLGAGAVILAGPGPAVRLVLANGALRWLGRISYSLYLVHWPLVVLVGMSGDVLPPLARSPLVLVALSVALGALLWAGVERRFYRPGEPARATPARTVARFAGAAATVVALTGAAAAFDGWPARVPAGTATAEGYGACRKVRDCRIGAAGGRSVIVAGDSHASHLAAGLHEWGLRTGHAVRLIAAPSCNIATPGEAEPEFRARCETARGVLDEALGAASDAPVLLVQRWVGYPREAVDAAVDFAEALGATRAAALAGTAPRPPADAHRCGTVPAAVADPARCARFARDAESGALDARLAQANVPVAIVAAAFCDAETCVAFDEGPLFSDYNHFSARGSRRAVEAIAQDLDALLSR